MGPAIASMCPGGQRRPIWGILLKGASRMPQLAVDAIRIAILGHTTRLPPTAGVAWAVAAALSLARAVLVVLRRDDLHPDGFISAPCGLMAAAAMIRPRAWS